MLANAGARDGGRDGAIFAANLGGSLRFWIDCVEVARAAIVKDEDARADWLRDWVRQGRLRQQAECAGGPRLQQSATGEFGERQRHGQASVGRASIGRDFILPYGSNSMPGKSRYTGAC